MIKIWHLIVEIISSEWMLTRIYLPNGGAVIAARSLITSIVIFLLVLLAINVIDPIQTLKFSLEEFQTQGLEKISWYGVIFVAVYTALYARFSAQWSYIAKLYNSIKQTECNIHNTEVMAEWKSGFIEDAENLHLSCKASVAPIIKAWGADKLVEEKFIAYTPGGQRRFDLLLVRVEARIKLIEEKYNKVKESNLPVDHCSRSRNQLLGKNKMEANEILDQLVKELFNEDELGAVIRAHIRLESLLLNIVELTAPHPEYLKKLDLDFDKTVTLSLLLGLKEEYAKPLRALGKLRNDFAHKPNMELSKNTVNNLYNSLHSEAKQQVQESFKNIKKENDSIRGYSKFSDLPPTDQLRLIVVTIWALVQSAVIILNE